MTPPRSVLTGTYDKAFYAAQIEGSSRSAAVVVPKIIELFPHARSVADVGCGTGVWLWHFKQAGFVRVVGIDGGDAGDRLSHLAPAEFQRADISRSIPSRTRFDLCLCLEVAEHVPEASAARLVRSLCDLSDIVVFGAAIPGQGGTQHINERWPSYWITHFERQGYACFDVIRPEIWYDERVEWWYSQNTLVFVTREREQLAAQLAARTRDRRIYIDVVHPRCFAAYRDSAERLAVLQRQASDSTEQGEIVRRFEEALAHLNNERDDLAHQLSALQSDREELAARLVQLEASTSWQLTRPLRRLLGPHPRVARALRRALKLAWWSLTFQLLSRLKAIRTARGNDAR